MRQVFLFLIIIVFGSTAFAQQFTPASTTKPADSTSAKISVPTIIHYTTPETDANGQLKYFSFDSTLDDLQLVNPAIKYFYNDLSTIGTASEPQLFQLHTSPLTYFGNSSFDLYKWKPEDIRYYKSNKAYSEISYHQSAGHEQEIKITLEENILKNWSAGFDFHRLGAQGFLNRGDPFHSNFDLFTWYHTPNGQYQVFASAIWNTVKNNVNGGVASDSLVNANDFGNAELQGVSVNLNDATQQWHNHTFSLNHFFDVGKIKSNDSTLALPKFRIRHDMTFETASYDYSALTDSSFYKNNYFSSASSDSIHYVQFKNKLSLTHFLQIGTVNLNYQLAGGYQWTENRYIIDTTFVQTATKFDNTFAEGRMNITSKDEKLKLTGGGLYVVNGDNLNCFSFDASAHLAISKIAVLNATGEQLNHPLSLMEKFYVSNHYLWWNNFENIHANVFRGDLEIPKFHFRAGIQNNIITSFIYFNDASLPQQSTATSQVLQLFVTKNFHYKTIRFNNTIWWQKTNNDAEIHLPEFLSHNSLYYESLLFKKKLLLQAGFDLHFTSGYYSDAYNPAISVFYLQDSIKTNNYPFADFFVTFKIKTARVFLKLQNIGHDVFAKTYYQTPHYPMPGLVFQLGINWRFFD